MPNKQIKIGAVLSYVGVAFNAVAGLLYTPWMVQEIGSSDYGLYTLAISVINFFLLDFGLGDAVSRFMSKYYAEGKEELANVFLGLAYKVYFIVAACIAIVLIVVYFFLDQLYGNLKPSELNTFKVLYVTVSLYSVVSFPFVSFNGVLTASEKFISLNLCNLLQKIFIVGLIIAALLSGAGVFALVAVNAAVSLAFIVVKYVIIRRTTSAKPIFSGTPKGMAKTVLGFSFWAMVVQICQRLIFSIMPSILAAISNSWEIAVFGLASSLEGYVWTVANALNSMFMPKVSRVLVGDNTAESLQKLATKLGRIQLHIVGGIIVAFAVLGSRFVDCWIGSEYSVLYYCVMLLIAPSAIELPLMIANTAIIAKGEVKGRGIVYIAMSVFNIAFGAILAGRYGALGASLSICLAYFLRTAGMCYLYKTKLNFRILRFFIAVYPKWLVASIFTALLVALASMVIPLEGWLGFCMCSFLFVILYGSLCLSIDLDESERNTLKRLMTRSKSQV